MEEGVAAATIEHGTLTFSQDWNIVCYTPDEGYGGLDTFSYHMVYDGYGYDAFGNYVCFGRFTTNVGVVQFQMDSYVDLAPTDPYDTDVALVGEDQSTTLTLTLQNPRSDGCATAGYWQLDFMTTTYVRVYDAQGAEILPGSKHYDVVTGSQDQITLTVVGQTGGVDDITACWTVWDGTHRVFEPDGSFVDIAGWCFFATDTATVDVVEVDIDTDSNNDGTIDPKHDSTGTDDPIENDADKTGKVVALHRAGVSDLVEADIRSIGVTPTQAGQLTGTLTASAGITVWADAAGTQAIIGQAGGNVTWDFYNQTIPAVVYVEGDSTGAATLTWTVKNGTIAVQTDIVTFTVLKLGDLIVSDANKTANVLVASDHTPGSLYIIQDSLQAAVGVETTFEPMTFGVNGTGKFIHITIVRSDGGTPILNTSCIATNFFAGQGLTATNDYRDFTITVWADLNLNNTCDTNEDYRIVYVHVVQASLHTVDYAATDPSKFHAITKDPTLDSNGNVQDNGTYGSEQWEDDNYDGDAVDSGEHDYPVCYTRSATSAGVYVHTTTTIRVLGNPGTNLKVRATGAASGTTIHLVQQGTATLGDGKIHATLESQEAIPSTIESDILWFTWEVSLDGGKTWASAGYSCNKVYITWSNPTLSPLYETCLYVGCNAAAGLDASPSEAGLVAETIFDYGFEGLDVRRVDGTQMTYWGTYASGDGQPDMFTTVGLLAHADGRCAAWANVFDDVLKAQGISSGVVTAIQTKDISDGTGRGFIVKASLPAQGNNTPHNDFWDGHAVVLVGTTIYDPSYGTHFASLSDWEAFHAPGAIWPVSGMVLDFFPNIAPA